MPHVSSVPATLANSTFVDEFYIMSVQPYVIIMREDNPLVISFLSNSNLLGQVTNNVILSGVPLSPLRCSSTTCGLPRITEVLVRSWFLSIN